MKILYILTNLNRSAPNTVIMNIIKNIHNSDVFILSLNKSQDDNYKKLLERNDIKYIEYQSFKKAFLNINKVLTQFKDIDILHLNGYHPNIYGFILKKFNNSYKLISTCHSVEDQEAKSHNFKGLSYFKTVVRLYLQKKFYSSHSRAIAVSNQVEEYLNSIGCTNAMTIYNGVEYDRFPKLSSKKSNKDSLDSSFDNRVKEANERLDLELHSANSVIVDKATEIENLQQQIVTLTKEKENLQKSKEIKNSSNKVNNKEETISLDTIIQTLNDDEKIVLETFFQNDSNMDKNKFKNILLDIKKMQKVTSEKTIQSLISKRILEDNSLYVILTGFGLEIVDKLFRGNI